jgi:hypothetical protein
MDESFLAGTLGFAACLGFAGGGRDATGAEGIGVPISLSEMGTLKSRPSVCGFEPEAG